MNRFWVLYASFGQITAAEILHRWTVMRLVCRSLGAICPSLFIAVSLFHDTERNLAKPNETKQNQTKSNETERNMSNLPCKHYYFQRFTPLFLSNDIF